MQHEDSSLIFHRPVDFCIDSLKYSSVTRLFTNAIAFQKACDMLRMVIEQWKLITR